MNENDVKSLKPKVYEDNVMMELEYKDGTTKEVEWGVGV